MTNDQQNGQQTKKGSALRPAIRKNVPAWEKITAVAFGIVFVAVILVIALVNANPTRFQFVVFKTVLSLASAGIAAVIPGFINISTKINKVALRAGGAMAVFALIYFLNPAQMIIESKPVVIAGRVADPQNKPIVNAKVTVDAYNFNALSKDDGRYIATLSGAMVDDVITIRAFSDGYRSISQDHQIRSASETVDITLSR